MGVRKSGVRWRYHSSVIPAVILLTPFGFGIGFLLGLRKNDGLGIAIVIGMLGAIAGFLFAILLTVTLLRGS